MNAPNVTPFARVATVAMLAAIALSTMWGALVWGFPGLLFVLACWAFLTAGIMWVAHMGNVADQRRKGRDV